MRRSRSPECSVTRVPAGNRTEPVGSRSPPSGAPASGRKVRSSGAADWCAWAIGRASAPQDAQSQAGVSSRGPSRSASASGIAATRRNTAFTKPAKGARPRERASATAVATAAWAGVPSSSRPAAPSRSTCRTGTGGAFFSNGSSTASSVPIRRSTIAANRCAAARSRESAGGSASSASSSGRCRSSTVLSSSNAASRVGSGIAVRACRLPCAVFVRKPGWRSKAIRRN